MKFFKYAALTIVLLIGAGLAGRVTNAVYPAQAQMKPEACQCTGAPLNLGAANAYISNCQCGAMQCIATTSALQCK